MISQSMLRQFAAFVFFLIKLPAAKRRGPDPGNQSGYLVI